MSLGKAQTIGYHYLMSLLMGIGRGPVDEIRQIKMGGIIGWDGHACDNSVQVINKPDLFGGEKKEGGIQGLFRPLMGRFDQVLPGASPSIQVAYTGYQNAGAFDKSSGGGPVQQAVLPAVKDAVGGLVSEFRGTAMLWFDGLVCSMNPYPKEWKIRVRRAQKGWYNDEPWYLAKAYIFLTESYVYLSSSSSAIEYSLQGNTGKITLVASPKDGDKLTINGVSVTFHDGDEGDPYGVNIAGDPNPKPADVAVTAGRLATLINSNALFAAQAVAAGTTVNLTMADSKPATIVHAMNGAHIVYQVVTDPEVGRGLPAELIDDNAFTYAANLFCNEGLGLCLKWLRQDADIEQFLQTVLDHLGAVLYTDRETGLLVLKALRDDYDPATLPVYTPQSGLLDIIDDDTASADTQYNECIVTGHSPISDEDIQARSQSPAGRLAQGAAATLSQSYPGLPTVSLCGRIAQRDLRASIGGLKKLTCTFDRRAWRITPGMPFKLHWPERGIENLIVRAGEINDAKLTQGIIQIKVTQDVFGLPATAFVRPTESGWSPPNPSAINGLDERIIEAGYRDLYLRMTPGDVAALQPDDAYISTVAASPASNSYDYQLISQAEGESGYQDGGTHSYTANAILSEAISETATILKIEQTQGFDEDIGRAALIDGEIVRIDAYDAETKQMTVARGGQDTVPSSHAAGARLWLTDEEQGSDGRTYATGEVIDAKVLTRTSSDTLDPDEAQLLSATMVGRAARPYPPADLKVNGVSVYAPLGITQAPVLTWVGRNRVTQADKLVGYFEAAVAEEAGTTYRAYVYDEDNETLLATHDGIASGWDYDAATAQADGAKYAVYLRLVAVRDGLESMVDQRVKLVLAGGYGRNYGRSYGR